MVILFQKIPSSTAKIFQTPKIAIQMVLMANCTFELFNADFIAVAGLWGMQVLSFCIQALSFFILTGISYIVVELRVVEKK